MIPNGITPSIVISRLTAELLVVSQPHLVTSGYWSGMVPVIGQNQYVIHAVNLLGSLKRTTCQSMSLPLTLVEHFKFFSENISEKLPLFFTLFTLKKYMKNFKLVHYFWVFISNFSPLSKKNSEKVWNFSHTFSVTKEWKIKEVFHQYFCWKTWNVQPVHSESAPFQSPPSAKKVGGTTDPSRWQRSSGDTKTGVKTTLHSFVALADNCPMANSDCKQEHISWHHLSSCWH